MAGRPCTICTHPERRAIDAALVDPTLQYRDISKMFEVSDAALRRHQQGHLPVSLVKAQEAAEVAQADDLLAQVQELRNKAVSILEKAEKGGDYRTALAGIREARACIELLAEMEGELDRRAQINIFAMPQYLLMIQTLHDYPEAALAVSEALGALDDGAD